MGACRWALPLVALQVASSKLLHQPVDLLRFTGQPEAFQEGSECRDEVPSAKVQLVHVAVHHFFVELDVLTQELAHLGLWMQGRCGSEINNFIAIPA